MKTNIIANVAISLDGKIEGPNGEYDWCFTDQDYGMKEFLSRTQLIISGAKSYQTMVNEGGDLEKFFGKIPWIVFSKNAVQSHPLVTHVHLHAVDYIRELKNNTPQNIWLFGGALLFHSLLQAKLIDEIMLSVHPIILGGGKDFFSNIPNRIHLSLINCKTFHSGLVQQQYQINY
ncbi:MAG: dihydrofolate reductase family protein [Cyclobacteriaceae bacterium]|jgi:dihydrofolate reductase|nr:dihydrofolate reductase family protein [Flammeovirgaceae bacterium]MCZ8021804.1 dihydrofolate reductase family protein [Cytophagales bacterium]MCZ8328313.1 dihydrofolate reductase family protein [Cyclobacteriaceae bacterium]